MKHRQKEWLWILLCAIMMAGFLSGMVNMAKAEDYALWVGGERVTSERLSDNGWSFTPKKGSTPNTLTLNGFSYSGQGAEWKINDQSFYAAILYTSYDPLVIHLTGSSEIMTTNDYQLGIMSPDHNAHVTIEGSGSLEILPENLSNNNGVIQVIGSLTVNSGTLKVTGKNTGIYATDVEINGGTVEAAGGSCGIRTTTMTVNGGTVTTAGGNTTSGGSYGITADTSVTITGGTLTATGGTTGDANYQSYGIFAGKTVEVTGGTVKATGNNTTSRGGYGIYAETTVTNGENSRLIASGSSRAIYGTVKNNITGSGWTDLNSTSYGASIYINTDGQTYNYQKIQFPELVFYPLYLGKTRVTSDNLSGTGWSFTPKKGSTPNTLTLNGFSYSGEGAEWKPNNYESFYAAILYTSDEPLVIQLTGSSEIKTTEGNQLGILSPDYNAPVTIEGSGSLEVLPESSSNKNGVIQVIGSLTVNSGTLKVTGKSTGLYAKDVEINGGTVEAAGGSCGIGATIMTVNGGMVTATGGNTTSGSSYGIAADTAVTVTGGTVTATGGTTSNANDQSYGIYAGKTVEVTGGMVTANGKNTTSGGGYGIYATTSVTVGENGRLTASGSTRAISGSVKNNIAGTGWPDMNSTSNGTSIAINTDGQNYDYKKIRFPELVFYPLYVKEAQVTSDNLSGTGWSFIPKTGSTLNTLALNGFSYSGDGKSWNTGGGGFQAAILYTSNNDPLVITLTGSNEITATGSSKPRGILSVTDITIEGSGSLNISVDSTESSGNVGMDVPLLTVNGGTVTAAGGETIDGSSIGISATTVTVNGGNLTATGENRGISGGPVTINGGTVTATGGGIGIVSGEAVTIGKGGQLTASGSTKAIDATVKNEEFGTGWTDTAGNENATIIEPSNTAQTISSDFRKVQFPGVHLHDLSYTNAQAGDSVTVTCGNKYGECIAKEGLTLTIKAPESLYVDGQAKTATLDGLETFNLATEKSLSADQITYASINPETQESTVLTSVPATPGTYTATLKYGDTDAESIKTSYTISLNPVTITGADQTVAYTAEGIAIPEGMFTITEGAGAVSYAVGSDTDTGVGTYDAQTGKLTVTKCGTFTVYAWTAETATHAAGAKESATLTVNKAEVTVTAKDLNILIGDAVPDLAEPVLGTHYTVAGLTGQDTLTAAPTLAYQKNCEAAVPDNTVAGTYDIVPSGASAGENYSISYLSGKLIISDKLIQTITASDVSVTYGDTDRSVSATTSGDGAISYAVREGSEDYIDVNASTGALTIKKAGTAIVIVTAAETEKYARATKEVTVTIKEEEPAPSDDPATPSDPSIPVIHKDVKFDAEVTTKGKNKLVLKWAGVEKPEKYEVYFSKKGSDLKLYKTVNPDVTEWTFKKLDKEKIYKMQVKAYITENGEKKYIGHTETLYCVTSGGDGRHTNAVKIKAKDQTIAEGEKKQLKVTLKGEEKGLEILSHNGAIHYESGNPDIATVDKDGKVKGVGVGSCKIQLSTVNGLRKSIVLTVKAGPEEMRFGKKKYKVEAGKTLNLKKKLKIYPEDAEVSLKWESSDKSIAKVDKNGKVTARKKGTVKITVTASNGVSVTVKVKVK